MPDNDKSIIPEKYRKGYKGASDWIGELIDKFAKDTSENHKGLDTNALFAFAEVNGLDVDKFKGDIGKKNAPGRLRMTVGNMLRAAARRRGGVFNPNGKWMNAPPGFHDKEPTEKRDGEKIAKAKVKEAEADQNEAA